MEITNDKKQQAACELIKEAVFQIREYLEENTDDASLRTETGTFSLISFMSITAVDWINEKVDAINNLMENGYQYISPRDKKMLKEFVIFYKEASGEMFFADNLFDVALDLLDTEHEPEKGEVSVRRIK